MLRWLEANNDQFEVLLICIIKLFGKVFCHRSSLIGFLLAPRRKKNSLALSSLLFVFSQTKINNRSLRQKSSLRNANFNSSFQKVDVEHLHRISSHAPHEMEKNVKTL